MQLSSRFICRLSDRGLTVEEGGAKAFNLKLLIENQLEVPPGFVVKSHAFREFLAQNSIDEIIIRERELLESSDYVVASIAAGRIREAILRGRLQADLANELRKACSELEPSELLAVRSSGGMEDGGNRSWAGQFDSFLQVPKEDVEDYVKLCWASFFGARAVSYGISEYADPATLVFGVILQEMIPGAVSGVAFSVDPASGNREHILIEAVTGLGDRLVSGKVQPYSLLVDTADQIILRRTFGSDGQKELLTAAQARELATNVAFIAARMGDEVDVEWTLKGDQVFILQWRPVTAINVASVARESGLPDILDYELTFKVFGLSYLFADLLERGFGDLHPLFMSKDGDFRQYFPNERMQYAARTGYRWLSDPGGFDRYMASFTEFHTRTFKRLQALAGTEIDREIVLEFFSLLYEYFTRYSRMDFQFTNLTYLYSGENRVVRENLEKLASFKDVARVWINRVSIDEDCIFAQFLDQLSRQSGVDRVALESYRVDEIADIFRGLRVSETVLATRVSVFLMFVRNGVIEYVEDQATAEVYFKQMRALEDALAGDVVIGQVANAAGRDGISGEVAVINVDYSRLEELDVEIGRMPDGAVLVSEFTAPELMGACKKASAIVTDLGGMLSHAAIVSRELNIPAIVGTKHASRSLSDGQDVRIDLKTGIVQVLP